MQLVIVRCVDGSTRELAVVEDLGVTVMLCSPERYGTSSATEFAVGFPKSDLIEIEEAAAAGLT